MQLEKGETPAKLLKVIVLGNLVTPNPQVHTRITYHRTWETGLEVAARAAIANPEFFCPNPDPCRLGDRILESPRIPRILGSMNPWASSKSARVLQVTYLLPLPTLARSPPRLLRWPLACGIVITVSGLRYGRFNQQGTASLS